MLTHVLHVLRCPYCEAELASEEATLRCPAGHSFDIARQGYVNLVRGDGATHRGDDGPMIAAREAFLEAGHLTGLREALCAAAADAPAGRGRAPEDKPAVVVDAGAGTGYYLAAVLDRLPGAVGVALDASRYALRRAARAHPRVGAVGCDIWQGLPLRDGCAAFILDVFSPRNGAEFRRILAPEGRLIVATPTRRHLQELVRSMGLLSVDEEKERRLQDGLGPGWTLETTTEHETVAALGAGDLRAAVAMGPSARHLSAAEIDERAAAVPAAAQDDTVPVALSVTLSVYRASTKR